MIEPSPYRLYSSAMSIASFPLLFSLSVRIVRIVFAPASKSNSTTYAQRARDAVALFRPRFKREPHEFPLLSLDLSKAHQPFTEVG